MIQRLPFTNTRKLASSQKTANGESGGISLARPRQSNARIRRSAAVNSVVVVAASSRGFGAKTQQPSSSSSSSSATAAKNEPPIPSSREEAIAQAATSLAASLTTSNSSSATTGALSSSLAVEELESLSSSSRGKKTAAKAKKAKRASSSSPQGFGRAAARVTLEVPIADESPEATAALAVDLIKELSKSSPPAAAFSAHLAFGDVDAALAASDLLGPESSTSVSALDDNDDEDDDDDGDGDEEEGNGPSSSPRLLVVIAPTPQQAPRVASLLSSSPSKKKSNGNFRSTDAALLNAKWEASAPPTSLSSGFSTAYAFVPLAVQGFLGATTTSGVMLCARVAGATAQPLWRIYKDEGGGKFAVVGRSQRRPGPRDIEDAFYNSAAASSPVTKGVAAITGLFNKKK